MGSKTRTSWMGLIIMISFALAIATAGAQATPPASEGWQFQAVPNVWFPGVAGNISAQGAITNRSLSLSDILNTYDYGGDVYFEGRKGKWAFFLEPTYLNLSTESKAGGFTANVNLEEWIVEFGGAYQFADLSIEGSQGMKLDVLLGGRYWSVENDIDISGFPRRVDKEGWVDPFIGVRLRMGLSDKLYLVARADIGGFDVGSEFSWGYSLLLDYRFSPRLSFMIGYRILDVNYEDGTGDSYFEYDVTMQGPILGLALRF
jgi:hypothetical protein